MELLALERDQTFLHRFMHLQSQEGSDGRTNE